MYARSIYALVGSTLLKKLVLLAVLLKSNMDFTKIMEKDEFENAKV